MRERISRALLALSPREFATRFRDELLETARALDRRRPLGPLGFFRAVVDAVATITGVRRDLRREAALPPPPRRLVMDGIRQDIRVAWRGLRRTPAFTIFVVIALMLGIGANAAMFGIVDRLLVLGPDHVRDADRVMRLYLSTQPAGIRTFTTSSLGEVSAAIARRATAFDAVATYAVNDVVTGDGAEAHAARAGYASAGLFPLLGVQAAIGRFFGDAEDATDGPVKVVVVGDAAWRSWYGGGADVIGRDIRIGADLFRVIGVAPRGFTGPELGRVDFWLPMTHLSSRVTAGWQTSWSAQWLQVVGRLRDGVQASTADEELTALHQRTYVGDDRATAAARMIVAPLWANSAAVEPPELSVVKWLSVVALLVLVITCANIANLLVARGVQRAREMALRGALGARRWRLVSLLLVESLILSLLGAAASLPVAWMLGGLARRVIFSWVEWSAPPVNARVFLASAIAALLTGIVIGCAPAWRATRVTLNDALKRGTREGRGRRSVLRHTLTLVQATLSVALIIGAGLFVRSLWNVRTLHLGVDPDRVLVAELRRAPLTQFAEGAARDAESRRRRAFPLEALPRLRTIPGVAHASLAVGVPFGTRFTVGVRIPGRPPLPRVANGPGVNAVADDYFTTVGTKLLRGRAFGPADGAGTEPVAIVNDLMAQTLWPGEDAIGRCFYSGPDPAAPCARIVGVAETTYRSSLREAPVMSYYIPLGQEVGFGGTSILLRSDDGDPARLGPDVRRVLTDLDPAIRYVTVSTMQDAIDPQTQSWRIGATVFCLSGLLALVVAAVGLYSVMSYLVADQTHEIGVRLALGARRTDVFRLILRGSVAMAVAGIGLGIVGALIASRFMQPLLFKVSARDPWVYATSGVVLLLVAFAAGLLPSLRASRIDPLRALRAE